MKRLALLYHPHKERAQTLALDWQKEISRRHAPEALVASAWDEERVEELCHAVDLILTLGGDGTLLRAARAGAACGVPALGVKLGHVGFLSELHPDAFTANLERLLSGDYWVEDRMMVQAHWR